MSMSKAIIYTEYQGRYQTHFTYSENAKGIDVEVSHIVINYSRHTKKGVTLIFVMGNVPLRFFGSLDDPGGDIVKDIIKQFTETGECKFQLVFDEQ